MTQLKKVYSQLNSAVQMATVDFGNPSGWDFCEFGGSIPVGSKQFYEKYLKSYLKVIKEYPLNLNLVGQYKWLNGNNIVEGYLPHPVNYKFVLNDGTAISLEPCWGSAHNQGVLFHVDLNGFENPPNTAGKDYFFFALRKSDKGKVLPWNAGSPMTDINDNCSKSDWGHYCTAKIMRDGWEIKYDW